jgi:rubrerythrin
MELESAIKTAVEFEAGAIDIYTRAAAAATEEVGRRVFGVLADEERHHRAYLETRLVEWRRDGRVTVEKLTTALPAADLLATATTRIADAFTGRPAGDELAHLRRAFSIEVEANRFYGELAATIAPDVRPMFDRILEIEAGHLALVKAEIDFLTGTGLLFDFHALNT